MINVHELLQIMIAKGASDMHLIEGIPPSLRINGDLSFLDKEPLIKTVLRDFLDQIIDDPIKKQRFRDEKELDFAYNWKGKGRFRVNVYFQKGSIAFSVRLIPEKVPKLEDLSLPGILKDLTRKPNGMVLVTGPTGCGKSTTLAAMVDLINQEQSLHIVTIEDPIEYVYTPAKSVVSQREVGDDTLSFAAALRHVLRQDPDVILVGEMRDLETMQTAITAAETGHLVFSTLHTTSAAQTVDRIIDVFPPYQQPQIRSQLAVTLQAVISQKLFKRADGKGRVPNTEILIATPAVRNMIREGKTYQINSAIEMGQEYGMQTMEQHFHELLSKRMIKR
ncbi:MAG TPA: type IV pili twitching motility protein PilT [Deltaproteobacteria bacterium]|nr:type IV pili twitching motility protein PilT [Deltaproteobacteria bacterium]